MATIQIDMTPYIRAFKQDPNAWAELRAAMPNTNQLRALIQGLENWFETPVNKLAAKASMEAEAGLSVSNTFAKKIAKTWMQIKFGGE